MSIDTQPAPIVFTDSAAEKVLSLLQDEDNPNMMLRVYIEGGGVSTSAELVLVLAASSGSYRDADLSAGALLSALGLVFMVFAPLPVHEILAVTNTLLLFLVGTMASRRLPSLRRLLTTDNRRREQTKVEASAAFHDEGVAATRERNGVLGGCCAAVLVRWKW